MSPEIARRRGALGPIRVNPCNPWFQRQRLRRALTRRAELIRPAARATFSRKGRRPSIRVGPENEEGHPGAAFDVRYAY
jgi:hypothetical protein